MSQEIPMPPDYLAQIKRMVDEIRARPGVRFAMPPPEIMVVAGLDQLGDRLARSDEAHAIIDAFVKERPIPTVFMLRVALDLAGVACDIVSLSELGLAERA